MSLANPFRGWGYDIFIIPSPGSIEGLAFVDGERRLINIQGSGPPIMVDFVILHEVFHHINGDCIIANTIPKWAVEFEADKWAMEVLLSTGKLEDPEDALIIEEARKAHLRYCMQPYIDDELWIHVDMELAKWAGCERLWMAGGPSIPTFLQFPVLCECMPGVILEDDIPF